MELSQGSQTHRYNDNGGASCIRPFRGFQLNMDLFLKVGSGELAKKPQYLCYTACPITYISVEVHPIITAPLTGPIAANCRNRLTFASYQLESPFKF